MTTEQREEMIAQLPEPQRRQMRIAQLAMSDMSHLSQQLQPSPEAPDVEVSTLAVIKGIATCPSFAQIDEITPGDEKVVHETVGSMQAALAGAGALSAEEIAICDALAPEHRRNVMLIYWQVTTEGEGEERGERSGVRHRPEEREEWYLLSEGGRERTRQRGGGGIDRRLVGGRGMPDCRGRETVRL